jgi:hypothetical protein
MKIDPIRKPKPSGATLLFLNQMVMVNGTASVATGFWTARYSFLPDDIDPTPAGYPLCIPGDNGVPDH